MRPRILMGFLAGFLSFGTLRAVQSFQVKPVGTVGTVQVTPGLFLAPEAPSPETHPAPMGTEIPLDSLRRLQRLPGLPGTPGKVPETRSAPPEIIHSFPGVSYTGWIPADPDIAVGYEEVAVVVNSTLQIYDKNGTLLYSNTLANFFANQNPPSTIFDPRVVFDPLDKRFVLVALALNASSQESYFLVAVSDDSTATGTWTTHKLDANLSGTWADFPALGFNQEAVIMTANQFSFSTGYFQTASVWIGYKSELYSGGYSTWTVFTGLYNEDGTKAFSVHPAEGWTATSDEYLLNTKSYGWDKVTLWKVNTAGNTPGLTRFATLSVSSYTPPPPAEQLGDTVHLNTGDCRISGPVYFYNDRLYASFTEKATWAGDGDRSALRWLVINPSTPEVVVDYPRWGIAYSDFYYPAVVMDPYGNLVLAAASSGHGDYAGLRFIAWNKGASGPTSATWLKEGEGAYERRDGYGRNRWGDYFDAAPDPSNPWQLWIYGMYATSNNQWATRIGALQFLPNLVADAPPAGWDFALVPRDTNDAGPGSVHLTDTLWGDSLATYLNLNYWNEGPGLAPAHAGRVYLDNEPLFTFYTPQMWPNVYAVLRNSGPYRVRGGRHTLSDSLDLFNEVDETNETDNFYQHQFVWNPPTLQSDAPVVRTPPPTPGNGAYPNSDGFRWIRPFYYAGAIGILPSSSSDDYDLYLYTDYVRSDSGFSVLARWSIYGSGNTDFVVMPWNVGEDTLYPAAVYYWASDPQDFTIEADDSWDHLMAGALAQRQDTLASGEILDLYECYLYADSTYYFSLDRSGGTAYLYLFPDTAGYYSRSQALRYSATGFVYTPDASGWYPLAVVKPYASTLPQTIAYTVRMERLPVGTWIGENSSDWQDPLNWVRHIVPSDTVDTRIPGWAPHQPVISGSPASTHQLILDSLAVLTLQSSSLRVHGDLWIRAGATLVDTQTAFLSVHGDLQNEGTLIGPGHGYTIAFHQDFTNLGVLPDLPNVNGAYVADSSGIVQEFYTTSPLPADLAVGNGSTLRINSGLEVPSLHVFGTVEGGHAGITVEATRLLVVYDGGLYRGDSLWTLAGLLDIRENGTVELNSHQAELYLTGYGTLALSLAGTLAVGDTFRPTLTLNRDLWVAASGVLQPGHSLVRFSGGENQWIQDTLGGTLKFYDVAVEKGAGTVSLPRNGDTLWVLHNFTLPSGAFVLGTEQPMEVLGNFAVGSGSMFHDTSGALLAVWGDFQNQGLFVGPGSYQSIAFYGDFDNTGQFLQTGSVVFLEAMGNASGTFRSTTPLPMPLLVYRPVVLVDSLVLPRLTVFGSQGVFQGARADLAVHAQVVRVTSGGLLNGDSLRIYADSNVEVEEGGTLTLRSDQARLWITNPNSLTHLNLKGTLDAGTSAPEIRLSGNLYVGPNGTLLPGHSTFSFVGNLTQVIYDTTSGDLSFYHFKVEKGGNGLAFAPERDTLVILGDLVLNGGTLLLPLNRYPDEPDWVHGDVLLQAGTLDLPDDPHLRLVVMGNWTETGGQVHEDHGLSAPSPVLIFWGNGDHHLTQRPGNSLGIVAFMGGQGYLDSDLTATAAGLYEDGDLNTQGHDLTLSRVLEFMGNLGGPSASVFTQNGGTIVCRGVHLDGSVLHLQAGTLRTSLDDPEYSGWIDYTVDHFNPAPGYTVEFVLQSPSVEVDMATGNRFGRWIVRKGNLWAKAAGGPTAPPGRANPVDLTLDSDVQVLSDLRIGDSVRLFLNQHSLDILASIHADSALVIQGTLMMLYPEDTLRVRADGANAWVTADGFLDGTDGYLFVNDTLAFQGSGLLDLHYQSDSTSTYGHLLCTPGSDLQIQGNVDLNTGFTLKSGATVSVSAGRFSLYGPAAAVLHLENTGFQFHDLWIGDGINNKPVSVEGPAPLRVAGTLFLSSGAELTLPSEGALWCTGDSLVVHGHLQLGSQGSALHLGNGTQARIRAGGVLTAIGSPSAPDTVTHAGSGYYALTFFSGSLLSAQHTVFEYMDAAGIRLFGTSLDPNHAFSQCTFRNSAPGGRLLLLNLTGSFTVPEAHFPENTWGGYVNVAKTISSGQVTFVDATGPFAGEAHEYDPYNTLFWQVSFLPGDANHDGVVNDQDLVYLANYLFHNGPAPNPLYAGDNDHDCAVTPHDLEYLATYLYEQGPAPNPCGTRATVAPGVPEPGANPEVPAKR